MLCSAAADGRVLTFSHAQLHELVSSQDRWGWAGVPALKATSLCTTRRRTL
jgi:hypothetical protein